MLEDCWYFCYKFLCFRIFCSLKSFFKRLKSIVFTKIINWLKNATENCRNIWIYQIHYIYFYNISLLFNQSRFDDLGFGWSRLSINRGDSYSCWYIISLDSFNSSKVKGKNEIRKLYLVLSEFSSLYFVLLWMICFAKNCIGKFNYNFYILSIKTATCFAKSKLTFNKYVLFSICI